MANIREKRLSSSVLSVAYPPVAQHKMASSSPVLGALVPRTKTMSPSSSLRNPMFLRNSSDMVTHDSHPSLLPSVLDHVGYRDYVLV